MTKIKVNIDGMEDLKNRLLKLSRQMVALENNIINSLEGLDLESANKESIMGQINSTRKKATVLSGDFNRLSNISIHALNAYITTDHRCSTKHIEVIGLLETVLKSFIGITLRTFEGINRIGLKILAAFNKVGSLFLGKSNDINAAKMNNLNTALTNNKIAGTIDNSKINNSIRNRIKIISKVPPFHGILHYNSNKANKDVELLQVRLIALGYLGKDGKPLDKDGLFGINTLYAVNSFKTKNHLNNNGNSHGKIDKKSWAALFLPGAVGMNNIKTDKIDSKNNKNKTPVDNKVLTDSKTDTNKDKNKRSKEDLNEKDNKKVKFGGATINQESADILKGLLKEAGEKDLIITSTMRSPHDQARVMYANLVRKGADEGHRLYGSSGDKVINVYERYKGSKTKSEIIEAMEKKIIELGPSNVSKHCGDPNKLEVIDISPNSITNKKAFLKAINRAIEEGKISKFIGPPLDPAYHIEIPQ